MPDNKCATCVECFKKYKNPRLQKSTCTDYIERYQPIKKLKTYVYEGAVAQ